MPHTPDEKQTNVWKPGVSTPKDAAKLEASDKQLLADLKAALKTICDAPLKKDSPLQALKAPNYSIVATSVSQFIESPTYRKLKNMLVSADLDFSHEKHDTIAAIAVFRQALTACEVWSGKEKVKVTYEGSITPLLPGNTDKAMMDNMLERFRRLCDAQMEAMLSDVKTLLAKVEAPLSDLAKSRAGLDRTSAREKELQSHFYRFYVDHKQDKLEAVSHLDVFLMSPLYSDLKALLYEEKPDDKDQPVVKTIDFSGEKAGVEDTVKHLLLSLSEVEKLRKDKLVKPAYPALRQESYQPPTPR